jgi:amino acid adenylation domain-containing protein
MSLLVGNSCILPTESVIGKIYNNVLLFRDKKCVMYRDRFITYQTLWNSSVHLSVILKKKGVSPGDIVIQRLNRGIEMIIGIIGIILAGAVYCPIHPGDPLSRLEFLINKTQCQVILSDIETPFKNINIISPSIICNDDLSEYNESYSLNGSQTLYLITTSGTTGTPKLVEISHLSLLNYINFYITKGYSTSEDVWLQFCRCTFDIHLKEIFCPLLSGGSISMISSISLKDIDESIITHKVTIFSCVPSFITSLEKSDILERWPKIRSIYLIGEPLTYSHLKTIRSKISQNCLILNFYGPAECTLDVLIYLCEETNHSSVIPLGTPMFNTKAVILDEDYKCIAEGQLGTLFLGGNCVMKGYLGDTDLTAQVIIDHPELGRLYNTGDLAKMKDGLIWYEGRIDFQVKIRGQRIELGEIEFVFRNHKLIQDILIIKREEKQDHPYLAAYLILKTKDILSIEDLSIWCKNQLQDYMIPETFTILEEWPLTPNGKIDRKQLPIPSREPTDELIWEVELEKDKFIHKIICDILHVKILSRNPKRWGLNSLHIIQLNNKFIELEIDIDLTDILECTDIVRLI